MTEAASVAEYLGIDITGSYTQKFTLRQLNLPNKIIKATGLQDYNPAPLPSVDKVLVSDLYRSSSQLKSHW